MFDDFDVGAKRLFPTSGHATIIHWLVDGERIDFAASIHHSTTPDHYHVAVAKLNGTDTYVCHVSTEPIAARAMPKYLCDLVESVTPCVHCLWLDTPMIDPRGPWDENPSLESYRQARSAGKRPFPNPLKVVA